MIWLTNCTLKLSNRQLNMNVKFILKQLLDRKGELWCLRQNKNHQQGWTTVKEYTLITC